MKKVVIKVIIACLIVAGAGTGGYYGYKKYKASKTTTATTAQYITLRSSKMNLQLNIQGTGSVFAGTSKDITTSSAGKINDLNVKVGDTVTTDTTLFTISNDSLQQAIDKAQIALDKQKLSLSNAKATLTTANENLVTAKEAEAAASTAATTTPTSNSQASTTTKALTVAEAQAAVTKAKLDVSTAELAVKDAERDLTSAKDAKSAATVKAPINGLVVTKAKSTGDSVQANTSVLTVIDTNSLKVKVAVDELDIQKVKAGQKAQISLGAIEGKTYEGTVEQIALTGTTSNSVTTYDVTVAISNPENIKLGMNATVTILVDSKENALVIPSEALVERNGKKYVTVPNADGATATSGNTSAQPNSTSNPNAGGSAAAGQTTTNNAQSGQTTQNNQTKQNRQAGQNGQTRQNTGTTSTAANSTIPSNGKLVEIKTGLETENYIEVLEGITEGQQLLVSLPKTSSTTTTTNSNRNAMGGFSGASGGGGIPPQMSGSGGGKN